jgi:hypothetical protein
MTVRATTRVPRSAPAAALVRRSPDRRPSPVTGNQLLALATSLRARGLRGLDVLRRSQDRAPPSPA